MAAKVQEFEVLIIGAGFSGLYMLHKLRENGFSAHVIEAGSGVGGTWYWNRYPGARCDVPSIEYSYSFSPELEADWRWSERYAAQPEILDYLNHVAERFDLTRDITFDTRVKSARWDDGASRWQVETEGGDRYSVAQLILATGALSAPKTPDLPGLENFTGAIIHTAQWDETVALAGKNIAIFGTGSSGIQAIPQLAKVANRLTVFQRTPNFAVPANNRPLGEAEWQESRRTLRDKRTAARASFLGFFEPPRSGSAKAAAPAEREQRFGEQWEAGTTGLLLAYEDLMIDEESNSHAAEFARRKIAEGVKDPEKIRKLTPQGYPLGSRRMCSEIGFYDTMRQANVGLVDVREDPVETVTANSIVTEHGSYPTDVIVFATGFDACIGAIKAIEIVGRDGNSISEEWADGPRSYLGLAIAGFPNLFTITGPGSPSVLSNVVVSIEQHVEWVAQCLTDLRSAGVATIEATSEAEHDWMEHVDKVAHSTLFPRANSWYQGRTRDGRQVFMPYVGGCGPYRETCNAIAADNYRGFKLTGV